MTSVTPGTTPSGGRFVAAQTAYAAKSDIQNQRAARVVAGRALDAVDCAEMLDMLGLSVPVQRGVRWPTPTATP